MFDVIVAGIFKTPSPETLVNLGVTLLGFFLGGRVAKARAKILSLPPEYKRVYDAVGGLEGLKAAWQEGEKRGSQPHEKRFFAVEFLRTLLASALPEETIPAFILNALVELIVSKIKIGEVKI